MFTGIIEGVGVIHAIKKKGEALEIEIDCGFDLEKTNIGDSISVNGCCLTVTSRLGRRFWADVSPESCKITTLGKIKQGEPVNLERARVIGDRMDGHIVEGHVDGVCKILSVKKNPSALELTIEIPKKLERYIVEKGSVAVDGVSLTVNHVERDHFCVVIIAHTKLATTFSTAKAGKYVNLEVDIIGKYVEKLTFLDSDEFKKESKITREFLKKHGF